MSSYQSKDIEFIKNTPSDELVKKHLKVLFKTYHEVFGEVCTGCPTKIAGYIKRLKNFNTSKAMKKSKSNFILKSGSQIIFSGESRSYSNANLTDEIAIRFLKGNKNRLQLFSKFPKNLDELLNDEIDETGEKVLKDFTVAELKEKYPEAKGRTKSDLIANIEESITAAATNDEIDETGEATGKASDEEE